jgi:hypothetical protein
MAVALVNPDAETSLRAIEVLTRKMMIVVWNGRV